MAILHKNFPMNPGVLRAACERLLPETLRFLRAMVEINSFTVNTVGVDEVSRLVTDKFAGLGFHAATVRAACSKHGAHLFLRTASKIGQPTLALVSHLDTVFPPKEELQNHFAWRPEGSRIYGPGTNDIKGGTALIWLLLMALREAEPEFFASVNWIVAFNACEEVDSADFGMACTRILPAETAACLIFEADGGEGNRFSVVAARKGRATFTVRVEGRGAHAGSGHSCGGNAIVQLAEVIGRLATLTDYGREVTVNVGTIAGGTVNNRVPHEAVATLEMRAFDPEVYTHTKAAILAMDGEGSVKSTDGYTCRVRVTLDDETPPWPVNALTERLVEIWRKTGGEVGLHVAKEARGGLSDGNVLWQLFPTLDGLGPRGENSHCSEQSVDGSKEQEWVDATSFVPKAVLNALAIVRLLREAD